MTLTHGDLCAGIAGFSLAFERAGFDTRWHVQWEPKKRMQTAQSILQRHFPDTPLLSDIHECGAHNLEPVDVITFGTPCQDLSTAGKRAGLRGERSVLFYEALRIVAELKPALAVWENVDGALSSHHGRDFARVLLAFQELGARDIGWTVLNAQYFGVPQRRRRVFVVADFRGERAAEILFESERLQRYFAPRRKAGPRVAATVTAGSSVGRGVSQPGSRREDDTNTVAALTTSNVTEYSDNQAQAGLLVAHALTAEGADASEDGTGRGTPIIVAVSLRGRDGGSTAELGGEVSPAMRASQGGRDKPHVLIPFDPSQLTSRENRSNPRSDDPAPTLHANWDAPAIAFAWQQGDDSKNGRGRSWVTRAGDYAGAIRTSAQDAIAGSFGVRRFTPRECERLMGFPDDWTRWGADGKEISDSARYFVLGNAIVVPVGEWLGRSIVDVCGVPQDSTISTGMEA